MSKSFDKLVKIMSRLRGEGGCPWDREQTHESLKPYLIEEAYETLEAIDSHDAGHFKEELGDLLLQIVFHAQIASEDKRFTIDDVAENIYRKLVRRHPHVFGDGKADTPDAVIKNWELIKKSEKPDDPERSVLDGVPLSMPSLLRAWRVQGRAKSVGFDFKNAIEAFGKVDEELQEARHCVENENSESFGEEVGDLLFSLVNVCRLMKINPEEALNKSTNKFIERFKYIEKQLAAQGKSPDETPLNEMDALWEEAKRRHE